MRRMYLSMLLTMKKPAARVSGLLCCCFCVSSQQRGSATVALQPCHTPASALLAPARRAPAFPAPACQAATALLTSAARVGGGQLLRLHRARRAGASKQLATDCRQSESPDTKFSSEAKEIMQQPLPCKAVGRLA